MVQEYKMLINGKWLTGQECFEVFNPYNNEVIGTVPKASKDDVENAIESARKAAGVMASMPAHQRSAILQKTSELIKANKNEIAEIIAKESGKAWKYAVGEAGRSVQTFKFASEEAKQSHGEIVPMDASKGSENRFGFFIREPIGIVGAISPFNFPINLVAHKVAPAIASGNSVVLKPASYTPLTALRLGEIMMEAGLPDGALNIIMGGGSTVGNWMVEDPRLAMITFTGSPPVGEFIKNKAGMKRVTLELGSNSAAVLDEDVYDFDFAVNRCVMGSYANSGQVCISIQRIFVHTKIYDTFLEKFVEATKKQVVGDPLDKRCDVGPMIDEGEAKRTEEWVNEAVEQGAKILTGGKRNRTVYEPTVLTNVKPEMKVVAQEIFAPVVSVMPFSDFSDALKMADDSIYGLQVGVFTKDVNKAFKAIKGVNVGGVIVNDVPTYRADHMPYGGNKLSGLGREGLKYAMEEMTNIKMVVFNL